MKVLLAGLTPAAVIHSWVLGTLVYAAFGAGGYLLVCMYFVVGSAVLFLPTSCKCPFCRHPIASHLKYAMIVQVTKLKLAQKQEEGIAEARSGRRSVVRSLL